MKKELREKYILIRNKIQNKQEKSKIITQKVKQEEVYKKAKVIAIYKSLPSEVDTSLLISDALKLEKTVALPRVMENDMMFYKIDSVKEHLEKSKFGIEEPKANSENYIDVKSIDLVIVPGVCFDTEKNRVGFGKGFYDRFLRNHNISTIAICFDEQILKHEKIPTSPFDVQVEKIITEQRTY